MLIGHIDRMQRRIGDPWQQDQRATSLNKAATIGDWRRAAGNGSASLRNVKEEMRANLLRKLEAREPLFPGVHGYEETVLPQITNAILARHNFILLGLRGQAKSRILRGLVEFLDAEIPYIAGCEIHDHPLAARSAAPAANWLPNAATTRRLHGWRAKRDTWKNSPRRT